MGEFKLTPEMTFSDLRVMYGTGRAYTVGSNRYDKKTFYRNGQMTKLGDIECSEWRQLMKELIIREGEEELQEHLIEWCKSYPWLHGRKEIEMEALELHASRIFDDEEWEDFLSFNKKYRPEALEGVEFVYIINECCNKPGRVTAKELKRVYAGTMRCPHCGRYTPYEILSEGEEK